MGSVDLDTLVTIGKIGWILIRAGIDIAGLLG